MKNLASIIIVAMFYIIPIKCMGQDMKIRLLFDGKETIVRMADNAAVTQFIAMLPADFEFSDFAGQEKISYFPEPIKLDGVARGMVASKGKMFIYVPWGNFGFYYKDHGTTLDKSLIPMGEVEQGLNNLEAQKGKFTARIELVQ